MRLNEKKPIGSYRESIADPGCSTIGFGKTMFPCVRTDFNVLFHGRWIRHQKVYINY
jgi:hypothetical protein